ncbi:hypothetical protein G5I_07184 [Acromyrmex echinatior]|uniref:Uncharacterized protein n=1 Tax=Acromyrmex echinatior TaxID=103372 RepID=F4WN37_ACREC|nr:hypothetical protein G5I_07184 [Acromyrmex echinatior]
MEGVRRSLEDGKGDRALTKLHGELFRLLYSPLAGTNSLIGPSRDEAKERTAAAWTSISVFAFSVRLVARWQKQLENLAKDLLKKPTR